MKTKRLFLTTILGIIAMGSTLTIANAQFMVTQSNDIYKITKLELNPGEEKTIELTIKNDLEEELKLNLYGADSSTSSQGSFTLKSKSSDKKTVGAWITVSDPELTLSAMESKKITYTIKVPEKVTPGTYGGGLAIGTAPKESLTSGSGAITSTRVIEPVIISIPGERVFKLNWSDFHYDTNTSTFFLTFENTGNIAQKINGEITLSGFPLSQNILIPLNEITLFQGNKIEVPMQLKEKPFFGILKAEVKINHKEIQFVEDQTIEQGVMTKEVSLQFIPWGWIIGLILVIVLLTITKIVFIQKHKKYLSTFESYTIQSEDTLEKLAQNRSINWKKLAKINKISPPYTLKVGAKLLIPQKK